LLSEWQRINVAFTRAKKKMIIIGDCHTLDAMEMLKTCIDICKERSTFRIWIWIWKKFFLESVSLYCLLICLLSYFRCVEFDLISSRFVDLHLEWHYVLPFEAHKYYFDTASQQTQSYASLAATQQREEII
jgi:hypothetical protein